MSSNSFDERWVIDESAGTTGSGSSWDPSSVITWGRYDQEGYRRRRRLHAVSSWDRETGSLDSIRAELVKSVAGTGEWNTKGIGFFAAAWERIWQRRGPRGPSISRHFWIWLMGLELGTRCCLEFICGQRLHGLTGHLAMMCWRAAYSAVRTCDRIRLCTHGSQGASPCHNEARQSCSDNNPVRLIVQDSTGGSRGDIYIYAYLRICFFHSIWDWSWLAFRQTCIAYVFLEFHSVVSGPILIDEYFEALRVEVPEKIMFCIYENMLTTFSVTCSNKSSPGWLSRGNYSPKGYWDATQMVSPQVKQSMAQWFIFIIHIQYIQYTHMWTQDDRSTLHWGQWNTSLCVFIYQL